MDKRKKPSKNDFGVSSMKRRMQYLIILGYQVVLVLVYLLYFYFSSVFMIYNLVLFFYNFFSGNIDVERGIPSIIIFNCLSFSAIFIILAIISENLNHLLKN